MKLERALVLGGARPGVDPVAAYAGVSSKPLIEIAGAPMLTRVVTALREAGISQIGVSTGDGAVAALARELGCEVLPAEAGPSQSALAGAQALGAPLLVTTADHALLEADWVTRFVAQAPDSVDLSLLMAERACVQAAAPETRRTYLKFADGDWSGCNLFLVRSERALEVIRLWRTLEADRKRPWRIIRRLGPVVLLRYLARRLTLQEALDRLTALTGAKAAVVPTPFGRAAIDVDKPADLDLVRRLLGA